MTDSLTLALLSGKIALNSTIVDNRPYREMTGKFPQGINEWAFSPIKGRHHAQENCFIKKGDYESVLKEAKAWAKGKYQTLYLVALEQTNTQRLNENMEDIDTSKLKPGVWVRMKNDGAVGKVVSSGSGQYHIKLNADSEEWGRDVWVDDDEAADSIEKIISEAVLKEWNYGDSGKGTDKIFVNNVNAKILYDYEMAGQISDGQWENASPNNHWQRPSGALVVVGNTIGTTWEPQRTYNFTNPELLDIVGDRMKFTIQCFHALPGISLDLLNYADMLDSSKWPDYNDNAKKFSTYVQQHLGTMDAKQAVDTIKKKYPYSDSQLIQDLNILKKAFRNRVGPNGEELKTSVASSTSMSGGSDSSAFNSSTTQNNRGPKGLDKYQTRIFTGTAFALTYRGDTINLHPGDEFGVRPAGTSPGMYRVVLGNNPNKVHSIDQDECNLLMKKSNPS